MLDQLFFWIQQAVAPHVQSLVFLSFGTAWASVQLRKD